MKKISLLLMAAACMLVSVSSCSSPQSKEKTDKAKPTVRQGLEETRYNYPLYGNVSEIVTSAICNGCGYGSSVITFNEAGDVDCFSEYDEGYTSSSSLFYDESGRLVSIAAQLTSEFEDGILETSRKEFVYDESGKLVCKNLYQGGIDLASVEKFFYDKKGCLSKSELKWENGFSFDVDCTYDKSGKKITELEDGILKKYKYSYDKKGVCTGYVMTSDVDEERREYKYDHKGNIIEVNDYMSGEVEPYMTTWYEITYAD